MRSFSLSPCSSHIPRGWEGKRITPSAASPEPWGRLQQSRVRNTFLCGWDTGRGHGGPAPQSAPLPARGTGRDGADNGIPTLEKSGTPPFSSLGRGRGGGRWWGGRRAEQEQVGAVFAQEPFASDFSSLPELMGQLLCSSWKVPPRPCVSSSGEQPCCP